jgi:hypothetical protein
MFVGMSGSGKYLFVRIIIILLFNCLTLKCYTQAGDPGDEICNDPNIKTILLYQTGQDLTMPVIPYKENKTIHLDFDFLDKPGDNYNYTVVNCMYDWVINTVSENLYLDGYNNYPINDYRSSLNTTRVFTHYSAEIPDENLQFLSSGNYLLKVFKNSEPGDVVFTKRFCINENLIEIKPKIYIPDEVNQEIQLEVDLGNLNLVNPLAEIKVVVLKNYDWNNPLEIKSSPMLRNNKLFYDLPYQILAQGGNEFRYFDTKTTKYESEKVNYIELRNPYYYFFLKNDKLNLFTPYFSSKDLNSRFYIDAPKATNRQEEADYVYVHFFLESPQPLGTNVYIYGALTNYKTDESNFMNYDIQKGIYSKELLLKQGYYNYAYVTRDFNKKNIAFDITEGSHSETENDYIILVYLRKSMSEIDRLIGFKIFNSVNH